MSVLNRCKAPILSRAGHNPGRMSDDAPLGLWSRDNSSDPCHRNTKSLGNWTVRETAAPKSRRAWPAGYKSAIKNGLEKSRFCRAGHNLEVIW